MIRKQHKDCKLSYLTIQSYQSTEDIIQLLDETYTSGYSVFGEPKAYSGNNGVLEIFPDRPKLLLVKIEGPMFILSAIYAHANTK